MNEQMQAPEPNQVDDCGEPLVALITVAITQRHLDWLNGQVADYQLGPTPECLDQGAVIRSLIHGQIQEDFTYAQYVKERDARIAAKNAANNHMDAHCRGEE